jgi:hypothetical protein
VDTRSQQDLQIWNVVRDKSAMCGSVNGVPRKTSRRTRRNQCVNAHQYKSALDDYLCTSLAHLVRSHARELAEYIERKGSRRSGQTIVFKDSIQIAAQERCRVYVILNMVRHHT